MTLEIKIVGKAKTADLIPVYGLAKFIGRYWRGLGEKINQRADKESLSAFFDIMIAKNLPTQAYLVGLTIYNILIAGPLAGIAMRAYDNLVK